MDLPEPQLPIRVAVDFELPLPEPRLDPVIQRPRPAVVPSATREPIQWGVLDMDWLQEGVASWYGPDFHGKITANGETFDTYAMTAAHKSLPFNTLVRVTNTQTGQWAVVRINDRGPYVGTRIIDLSYAAADAIDMVDSGTAPVRIEVVQLPPEDMKLFQLGSYGRQENALALVQSLQTMGFEAAVEHIADRGLYRVIIPNVLESEVQAMEERLRAQGINSFLVRAQG